MSFTDQKFRVATEEHVNARWGGIPNGKRFRCYLCGHKFVVGDEWRWVMAKKFGNLMICKKCDGPDVMERWYAANEELKTRFWWFYEDY